MDSIIVTYNGTPIHSANDNTTFTLNTDDNYLEGDVVVAVSFPDADLEAY